MIGENQFVRENCNDVTQVWFWRNYYRSLTKKEKKSFSRDFTKFKQKLSFKEWWAYITQRIREGKEFQRLSAQLIITDPRIEQESKRVRDEEFREYLGHIKTKVDE